MEEPRHFGHDHRFALTALILLTVAIFTLSFLQFQKSVRAPFERSGPGYLSQSERSAAALEAQKTSDTDKDGLSDYDELYLYRTSPYLDDTDSDGFPDGQEINSGNDPNCHTGSDCGSGGEAANVQKIGPTFQPPPSSNFVGGGDQILGGFDPDTVRTLLRGAGVSEDVLSKIDDAGLKVLYEQALNQMASSTVTSTSR